jgi:hypothetical protein
MIKKHATSLDYRKLADGIWQKAVEHEVDGLFELAEVLKGVADQIHDIARKKFEEEKELKKLN